MDFKTIVASRYATKKFDGRNIDQKKVDELFELIRYSASSFNIQPWRIKVITDQKTKQMLRPLAYDQEQITTCSHLLVFCADTDITTLIERLEVQLNGGMPEEALKNYIGMMKGMNDQMTPAQKLAWAQKQTYIALGNALNGAKSLGFDSCPMEGFDPAAFARALDLPSNLVPAVLCPIGYGADKPKPKMRFAKDEVFF